MSSFVCRLCHKPIPEPLPIVGERPTDRYVRIGQALALHIQTQHEDTVSEMLAAMMQFQTYQLYAQYTCPNEVADEMNRLAEHLRSRWLGDAEATSSPIIKP